MATETPRRDKRERARPRGPAPPWQRARRALRHRSVSLGPGWWLAVAVVAGLFAMHGLDMHGLHSAEGTSSMHSASRSNVGTSGPGASMVKVSAAGMTSSGHDDGAGLQVDSPPADLDAASLGSASGSSHEPSGGAGLLGMCLALLAFGVLWIRRWGRVRPAWTFPRRAFTSRVAQLPVTARDLGPPPRAELSIWRC